MAGIQLYDHWRSSSAFRVRIALNYKDVEYVAISVDPAAGEADQAAYRAVNPMGSVPTLVDGERVFTQSLAIIEYLDDAFPEPPLLPHSARDRAHARAMAQMIASDVQPMNCGRVKRYLAEHNGLTEEQWLQWSRHWIREGLNALEVCLRKDLAAGSFLMGDSPTIADCCLIPELYNARQVGLDVSDLGGLLEVEARCMELPAFRDALPEEQPDAKEFAEP
ncbi:MAG: maleylacetoacetate isomerase [Chromatiales bacterium]|nr:maleylacetoacetate isomerase [Chromatiales bacterium]